MGANGQKSTALPKGKRVALIDIIADALFEKNVLKFIGNRHADTIRRADIADLLARIGDLDAMRLRNRVLGDLRQMFRFGAVLDIVAGDPTLGLKRIKAGEAVRERYLSDSEITLLANRVPESGLSMTAQATIWVLLGTAVRVVELSCARVEDVDLDAGTWLLPNTKNRDRHLVQLSEFVKPHFRILIALSLGGGLYRIERTMDPLMPKPCKSNLEIDSVTPG